MKIGYSVRGSLKSSLGYSVKDSAWYLVWHSKKPSVHVSQIFLARDLMRSQINNSVVNSISRL